MRTILTFVLLIILSSTYSQNSDFATREIIKQLDYELQIIDSLTFSKVTSEFIEEKQKEIIPRIESDFVRQYPQIFKKENKCYNIKGMDIKPFYACEYDSTKDIKERSQYEFKGQYCDFALIYVTGYEWWGYISVDLTNGIGFYTMGIPLTCDCITSFSYSNYYGEEELSITNMETKKQLVIGIENWTTIELKQKNKDYYLKLEPFGKRGKQFKYIKIEIK